MPDVNPPASSSQTPSQTTQPPASEPTPSQQTTTPQPPPPQSSIPTSTPPPQQTTPPPSSQVVTGSVTPQVEYASFGRRTVASLLDGIILTLAISLPFFAIFFAIGLFFGASSTDSVSGQQGSMLFILSLFQQVITFAANIIYPLYFIGSRGQTPGKMIMKIKVLRLDQTKPPGYTTAFIRETVGKILSSIVFGLGFLWVVWDDKKQGWHDKIAKTVVVKVE